MWIISVPVWGNRCLDIFCRGAAPALMAALERLREPWRFVVHTDRPDLIAAALPGCAIEFRSLPRKPTYIALQESHADALRAAAPGDRVVLLNADLVVSGNLLEACAGHIAAGKRAVVLLGIRTAQGPELPPAGAAPRALLEWAWAHRHQIIKDLEWPHGGSMLPTNLFWSRGSSVVARGFHLHPVAVLKSEDVSFQSTIDGDLLDHFPRELIHVVTSPDDCAMAEVSPPERRFPVRAGALTPAMVAASMRSRASETHQWLATHRIGVVGEPVDCGDEEVVCEVLSRLAAPEPPPRRLVQRGHVPAPRVPRGRRGHPR